jgi:hypothetical protein
MPKQPQHLEALALANEIRFARAQVKRDIKAGEVAVSDILRSEPLPSWADTMYPEQLLCAIPRFPRKVAHGMLSDIGVSFARTLGQMSPRQRCKLAARVQAREYEVRKRNGRQKVAA